MSIQVDRLDFDSLGCFDLKMDLISAIESKNIDLIEKLLLKLDEIAAKMESDDLTEIKSLYSKSSQLKRMAKMWK